MTWFIDAHEDLAFNIVSFNRNYTLPVSTTREAERNSDIPTINGDTLLGYPEYVKANVRIVFATLFAIPARPHYQNTNSLPVYNNPGEANYLYWQQLEVYKQLSVSHPKKFLLIKTSQDLSGHLSEWQDEESSSHPVGIIPLMEGADGILSPDELQHWWDSGLGIIGLAWAGNRYCGGTNEPGPITTAGQELLKRMAEIGFILDISHMDSLSAYQSIDIYPGKIIASHSNACSLVRGYKGNRLLTDDLIRKMIDRDIVIGVVPFNNFLDGNWSKNRGKESVSLSLVAQQIEHICQLAGDANHVGIGTDFDGGFGCQSTPREIDSIADIPKINPLLSRLGFTGDQIDQINHGNFLRVIESQLPFRKT